MVELDRIKLSEGMVLAKPVICPKTGKMLLNYGTLLTESHIASFKDRNIPSVFVVEQYTLLLEPATIVAKTVKNRIEAEIHRLSPPRSEANKSDDMMTISENAVLCMDKIMENPAVVEFCTRMMLIDHHFLFNHCIETCALSMLLAGIMKIDGLELQYLAMAALLHDIGLCELPLLIKHSHDDIRNELSWQEHARYGYYFSKEADLPMEVCDAILHHHEKWNGEGFPDKLAGEEIPLGSRIIAVCEQYNRLLRLDNMPHYQAIEFLYGAGNFYFDSQIVQAFSNSLAVYPLGSMVRLSTGEVGIVVNVRKNLGPRPIVRVYYNRVNRSLSVPRDVDLANERTVFIEQVL